MKRAEDCNSIEEILDCIDELDKEIIHNLSIRSTFVKNAAKLMKSGEDIKNGYYIESMIKTEGTGLQNMD
jgi:chorismate mutase